MSASSETYYDVLGVSRGASAAAVKAAFQAMARRYHPDTMHGQSPDAVKAAEARFHRVHEAWSLLQDSEARAAYDRTLEGTPHPPHCTNKVLSSTLISNSHHYYGSYALCATCLYCFALVSVARSTLLHTEVTPDDAVAEPCPTQEGEFVLTVPCRCGNPLHWHTADLISTAGTGAAHAELQSAGAGAGAGAAGVEVGMDHPNVQRCSNCSQSTYMLFDLGDDDDNDEDVNDEDSG